MEYKSLLEIKSVDDATGEFSGYLAVFGDVDTDSDIIIKGAFKVTLASARTIPILWQHIVTEPIGLWTELKEDDHGLFAQGKLAINTELGSRAYALLKMRAITGLSIGYVAIQKKQVKGIRQLIEIKLFEGSIVTFPANAEATVTTVKGQKLMHTLKDALAAHELRKDLNTAAWTIEDAKDDSMDSIMSDTTMDKPAKKAAARKTLHDAADLHADLQDQRIDALPEPEDEDSPKSDDDSFELKAAKHTMTSAIAAHVSAERKCMKAMDLLHGAMALHTKGIVLARQLSYAGISDNDDKNAAAAAGKKAAEEIIEYQALMASLTSAKSKLAA